MTSHPTTGSRLLAAWGLLAILLVCGAGTITAANMGHPVTSVVIGVLAAAGATTWARCMDRSVYRPLWTCSALVSATICVAVLLTPAKVWWPMGGLALALMPIAAWRSRLTVTAKQMLRALMLAWLLAALAVFGLQLAGVHQSSPSAVLWYTATGLFVTAVLATSWAISAAMTWPTGSYAATQRQLLRNDGWLLVLWLLAVGLWLAAGVTTQMFGGQAGFSWVGSCMLALAAMPIQAVFRNALLYAPEDGLAQQNVIQLAAAPILPLVSTGYGVSLFELDMDGKIVNIGPGGDTIWRDDAVIGSLWLDRIDAADRATQAELLLAARHGNTSCGHCKIVDASCTTVAFAIRRITTERITVLVRPMDVYLKQLQATREAAETDTLSGLHDRVAFLREATVRLQAAPESGRWCLMNCELRVLAHADAAITPAVEDRLWRESATRIAKGVDHDALVGRTGSNQLSLLLPVADDESATRKARGVIADGVATTEDSQGWKPQVGLRVGLAIMRPGQSHRALISDAEMALAQSLQHQWGTVMTGTCGATVSELETPVRGKVLVGGQPRDLTSLMRADRSAEVFFEPVALLATGTVDAVQLHVRWRNRDAEGTEAWLPDAAMLNQPDQIDLDRRCLRAALNHVASWRSGRWPKLSLVFPVSARTVAWRDFSTYVQHCLANTATPPAALTLALPVSDLADDKPAVREAVQDIREVGIKIAVVEDNTGGSLLDALRLHAVDTVMLGERFVAAAGHQARTMALLTSLVSMAFDLGANAAASGVSTTAQARLLRRLGVNFVSGPLCGEPMPTRSVNEGLAGVTQRLAALKSETPIVALARNKADTINLTD